MDKTLEQIWNKSYIISQNEKLWGEDSVPYVRTAIKHLNHSNNGKLFIDIPCGDGRNLTELCKFLPFVIGADYSINALNITQKRMRAEGIQNTLLQTCDIFSTKYLDNQFDGIFCWDLLGHLKNVEQAIFELLRISKSGGRIIGSLFSTGDSTLNGEKMKLLSDNEFLYNEQFYFKYYELKDVEKLIKKFESRILTIEKVQWMEGPHEGYREYEHSHESWVFVLEKL